MSALYSGAMYHSPPLSSSRSTSADRSAKATEVVQTDTAVVRDPLLLGNSTRPPVGIGVDEAPLVAGRVEAGDPAVAAHLLGIQGRGMHVRVGVMDEDRLVGTNDLAGQARRLGLAARQLIGVHEGGRCEAESCRDLTHERLDALEAAGHDHQLARAKVEQADQRPFEQAVPAKLDLVLVAVVSGLEKAKPAPAMVRTMVMRRWRWLPVKELQPAQEHRQLVLWFARVKRRHRQEQGRLDETNPLQVVTVLSHVFAKDLADGGVVVAPGT